MNANDVAAIFLTGIGATALTDLGALARKWLFALPLPNFALVGRWIGHMANGRVFHDPIAAAAPLRSERAIGWVTHYLIGVGFAGLLPLLWGTQWLRHPTPIPALLVGVGSVAAPYLLMQPAMGAGIAASRTPRPGAARLQSLITHVVFGVSLYLAALIVSHLSTGE
jgi:hypothetical protein